MVVGEACRVHSLGLLQPGGQVRRERRRERETEEEREKEREAERGGERQTERGSPFYIYNTHLAAPGQPRHSKSILFKRILIENR